MIDRPFEFWFSYPCELTPSGMIGPDEDVFILRIELVTGDVYELTVWTDAYLARRRQQDLESGEHLHGQYLSLPDLVVADKDVTLIEQIIADLVQTQHLRPEWIVPDEFTVSYDDFDPASEDVDDLDDSWVAMPEAVAIDVGWSGCHGRPAA